MKLPFKLNVGSIDSTIRLALGAALVYVGFINPALINDHITSTILGILGIVGLATGIVRYCPLYTAIDLNTRKADSNE